MRALILLGILALGACTVPIPSVPDSDPVFALQPDKLQPEQVPQ